MLEARQNIPDMTRMNALIYWLTRTDTKLDFIIICISRKYMLLGHRTTEYSEILCIFSLFTFERNTVLKQKYTEPAYMYNVLAK